MSSPKHQPGGMWNSFNFLTKVTYGGVLGKVAAVGIVFLLLLGVFAIAGRGNPYLLWGLLASAVLGLLFSVGTIVALFRSNPEMATLEGTEVIRYRQLMLKSKDEKPARVIEITADPELPEPATQHLTSSTAFEEEQ